MPKFIIKFSQIYQSLGLNSAEFRTHDGADAGIPMKQQMDDKILIFIDIYNSFY